MIISNIYIVISIVMTLIALAIIVPIVVVWQLSSPSLSYHECHCYHRYHRVDHESLLSLPLPWAGLLSFVAITILLFFLCDGSIRFKRPLIFLVLRMPREYFYCCWTGLCIRQTGSCSAYRSYEVQMYFIIFHWNMYMKYGIYIKFQRTLY